MASANPTNSDLEAVVEARKQMNGMIAAGVQQIGPCPDDLEEINIEIPIPDGTRFRTLIVRPKTSTPSKVPLIIFFHGGSFTFGNPEFCLSPARGFARLFGAVVACPSYKYIPEHPFPGPMHSAWEIVAWLSKAENLNLHHSLSGGVEYDPSLGVVLAGISAGAVLSAAIAGISAATKVPNGGDNKNLTEGLSEIDSSVNIKGLFLSVPLMVHEDMLPAEYAHLWTSRAEYPNAPIVNVESLAVADQRLQPDHSSPWYSPLNLDLEEISPYFPKRVYLQAGQLDHIRDDAVVFEAALRDKTKGFTETRIDVVEGIGHTGWCTVPMPEAHSTELRSKSLNGMGWLLDRAWDSSVEIPL